MNKWRVMAIFDDYALVIREGSEKEMRSFYKTYKDWNHVYRLLSPQQYKELHWEF